MFTSLFSINPKIYPLVIMWHFGYLEYPLSAAVGVAFRLWDGCFRMSPDPGTHEMCVVYHINMQMNFFENKYNILSYLVIYIYMYIIHNMY